MISPTATHTNEAAIARADAPVAAATTARADTHPAAVYLASLSEGSRRTMKDALDTIAALLSGGELDARLMPWGEVRYQHTQAVRSELAEHYAPATVNKMIAALRGCLKECWRLGQMPAEDYHRAIDVQRVRGETLPKGRALPQGEIRALFAAAAAGRGPIAARNSALVAALYGAGLRRSEAAGLDLGDYDRDAGDLKVRNGKGKKERLVPIPSGCQAALEAWLDVRGDVDGPLFVPVLKGGRIVIRSMSPQSIYDELRRLAETAEVPPFSPHDFRRSYISDLLDLGADIATVQKLAGHAQVTTTAKYDRRGERAKRSAAELLHVPYVAHGA